MISYDYTLTKLPSAWGSQKACHHWLQLSRNLKQITKKATRREHAPPFLPWDSETPQLQNSEKINIHAGMDIDFSHSSSASTN